MTLDISNFTTLMGWNQKVKIDYTNAPLLFNGIATSPGTQILRVESYNIGVKQTGDAPDYVTGRSDRTAWRKGKIESDGDLSYPFTLASTSSNPSGLALFICAAQLVDHPEQSFDILSSAHPLMTGCKVNTARIECSAENEVRCNATVWGVVSDDVMNTIHSYGSQRRLVWGPLNSDGSGTGDDGLVGNGTTYVSLTDTVYGDNFAGVGAGSDVSGELEREQIPMWDVCSVEGAPVGMFIVGFSIEISNELKRNYTMGTGSSADATHGSSYSPFGLNPTTISANQRRITGTITWQSNHAGNISEILGVGVSALKIHIGYYQLTLNNVLWNSTPPTLAAGDRVTVESSFTALGDGGGFDALTIEANDTESDL